MAPLLINSLPHNPDFTTLRSKPYENIVGKGQNAGDHNFLLFPQYILLIPVQTSIFEVTFILSSTNAFNLDQSEILLFSSYGQ